MHNTCIMVPFKPNINAFAAYPFHGGAEYQQEKLVEKLNQEIREKDNLTSRNQELSEKAQSLEQNCQIAREEITTLQTTIRELQENLHKSRAKAEDLDSQLKAIFLSRFHNIIPKTFCFKAFYEYRYFLAQ